MVYPTAGITVGEGCGWIRVFTTPSRSSNSTLVYLNLKTTVADIAKDLVLPSESTLWLQFGGGDSRCLLESEKPLNIQEEFLSCLGYTHPSRRTRLSIQQDISYLIAFHIGPKTREFGGHGGLVDVYKNLVVPYWKKRYICVLGSTLIVYPLDGRSRLGGGWMDQVELYGARIEEVLGSRSGKQVLRVTSTKELILGFQETHIRDIWYKWILQGSESGGSDLLDLSGTGLVGLPPELTDWKPGVQQLELGSNALSPQSLEPLAALSSLKRLSLAANKLPSLPESLLASLTHLISLDLSDNKLQQLPSRIAHLPCLEVLKLDRNLLEVVPSGPYAKLKVFSATNNRLVEVPPFITQPSHMRALTLLESGDENDKEKNNEEVIRPEDLTSVNLRSNLLKGSIILGNYGNLTQLDVSENSIENLDLSALSKLQTVQCSKNKLQQVTLNGSSLVSLIAGNNNLRKLIINPKPTKLKHLDISYNWLEKLPEWLSSCHHLRTLFASHNRLASLPDHLFCSELSSLQTLQLSFNKLTALPQVIRHIPLQQLFLQSNQISSLPQHFFLASSRMRVLNVSKNWLDELPSVVGDGHQLERLYLTANRLKNISSLTRFNNLRVLHLAYNTVTQLPDNCVNSWPELEELVVSGNRINSLPSNIVNWQHLRVLRLHCNVLSTCPSLSTSTSLKVLDLSHNQLDKIILSTLIPKQLQSIDLSGNARLHVDPSQFQQYKSQRKVSLVDVSGQNRNSLPCLPKRDEMNEFNGVNPWTLGFSETSGNRERLCISQLRLTNFCQNEALLGLFDGCNNSELPEILVAVTPRIIMEERTVKETASDYMKYTLLSAHRELKEKGQRLGVCAMVCHIVRERSHPTKCVLRIASVGEAKAVLRRAEGIVTLAHVPTQPMRSQLGNSSLFPMVVPDPHVTELCLRDTDEFIIIANKRLWEVLSPEEATTEVRDIDEPVLAAKRLQDLAQSYGCEDNLSIMVLRVHPTRQQQLIRELSYTLHKPTSESSWCDPMEDRSSPSGQSDGTNTSKHLTRFDNYRHYTDDKNELLMEGCQNFQSVLMRENGIRKMSAKLSHLEDHMADCEESSSDSRSGHMSEEQFRCWEYMLEKNTQLLFDKELDTLSRGFTRRSVPARTPSLWGRSRSNPHLSNGSNGTTPTEPALLTRQFGSSRSFQGVNRLGGSRRSINSGPNAAYFGSLQRLMPYNPVEYDFTAIKERNEQLDSLDQQEQDRMTRYWDVATTEL